MKKLRVSPSVRANIAASIKLARAKSGLTSRDFGALVGVAGNAVSNWENMQNLPTEDNLVAISKAVGVPVQLLMNGSYLAERPDAVQEPKPAATCTPAPAMETLCEIVNRMCNSCVCDNCIIGSRRRENERICSLLGKGVDIEDDIAAVRKWGSDNPPNPVRTYKSDFIEKYPNALIREDGSPVLKVNHAYGNVSNNRLDEFNKTLHARQWDKPLGYWEA